MKLKMFFLFFMWGILPCTILASDDRTWDFYCFLAFSHFNKGRTTFRLEITDTENFPQEGSFSLDPFANVTTTNDLDSLEGRLEVLRKYGWNDQDKCFHFSCRNEEIGFQVSPKNKCITILGDPIKSSGFLIAVGKKIKELLKHSTLLQDFKKSPLWTFEFGFPSLKPGPWSLETIIKEKHERILNTSTIHIDHLIIYSPDFVGEENWKDALKMRLQNIATLCQERLKTCQGQKEIQSLMGLSANLMNVLNRFSLELHKESSSGLVAQILQSDAKDSVVELIRKTLLKFNDVFKTSSCSNWVDRIRKIDSEDELSQFLVTTCFYHPFFSCDVQSIRGQEPNTFFISPSVFEEIRAQEHHYIEHRLGANFKSYFSVKEALKGKDEKELAITIIKYIYDLCSNPAGRASLRKGEPQSGGGRKIFVRLNAPLEEKCPFTQLWVQNNSKYSYSPKKETQTVLVYIYPLLDCYTLNGSIYPCENALYDKASPLSSVSQPRTLKDLLDEKHLMEDDSLSKRESLLSRLNVEDVQRIVLTTAQFQKEDGSSAGFEDAFAVQGGVENLFFQVEEPFETSLVRP